jgi:hypothetical protein
MKLISLIILLASSLRAASAEESPPERAAEIDLVIKRKPFEGQTTP